MTAVRSIPLTAEQHAFVQHLVASGRYSDEGAVLRRSLELQRRETRAEDETVEAFRDIRGLSAEWQANMAGMRERLDILIALLEERLGSSSSGEGEGR